MAILSRDQVKNIIQNAPAGTTPQGVIDSLRKHGHTLEGDAPKSSWLGDAAAVAKSYLPPTAQKAVNVAQAAAPVAGRVLQHMATVPAPAPVYKEFNNVVNTVQKVSPAGARILSNMATTPAPRSPLETQ